MVVLTLCVWLVLNKTCAHNVSNDLKCLYILYLREKIFLYFVIYIDFMGVCMYIELMSKKIK